jgi:hypothetical protein
MLHIKTEEKTMSNNRLKALETELACKEQELKALRVKKLKNKNDFFYQVGQAFNVDYDDKKIRRLREEIATLKEKIENTKDPVDKFSSAVSQLANNAKTFLSMFTPDAQVQEKPVVVETKHTILAEEMRKKYNLN